MRTAATSLAKADARIPENRGLGFDGKRDDVPVAKTLATWEKAGDARVWKLMVSPENGDRMNLRRHARELMDRLGAELGTKLTWVAVEHDHNGHPHRARCRTVRDIERAREAGVNARYVGALDLEIERRVDAHRSVGFRREPAAGSPQHLLWRRLEHL